MTSSRRIVSNVSLLSPFSFAFTLSNSSCTWSWSAFSRSRAFVPVSFPANRFETASTVRVTTPFLAAPVRPVVFFRAVGVAVLVFEVTVDRGLLAVALGAVVRFVVVLLAVAVGLLAVVVRVVFGAVRALAAAFERAVAVRAAVVRVPLLLGVLDVFRVVLLLPLAELPLLADVLRAVEDLALPLPVIFFAVLLRAEVPLRPAAGELFFAAEDRLADERLLLAAVEPFLPAALFLADVLRVERELEPDFFELPLEDLELEAFFEPPDEDRDDELFFAPLLLLDDEREPLDFFVVAMRIIPPIVFGVYLHYQRSAKCVPFCILYQVETSGSVTRRTDRYQDKHSSS